MDSKSLTDEIEKDLTDIKLDNGTASNKLEERGSSKTETTLKSKKEIIILPDTSWLVAILDENDSHYIATTSSLGALLPYSPSFYVPVLVAIETMSRLVRGRKKSVKACRNEISKLLAKKLKAAGRSTEIDFVEILDRYKAWSRKTIKNMTAIDFCIVTEGIAMKAKILTCDLKMYHATKKYYKDIYFMTDKVQAQESDLARLIHDIQISKK